MGRQTEVKARSRNRRLVWVVCTSLGCDVLCRMWACRVFWEEGAEGGLGGSWARAHDVRMCVVREARLRGRGRAQRGWYGLGALDPRGSGICKSALFGLGKGGFKRLLRNLLIGLVRVMLVSTC